MSLSTVSVGAPGAAGTVVVGVGVGLAEAAALLPPPHEERNDADKARVQIKSELLNIIILN